MGQINILDSGYIRPTNAGTQASSANRARLGLMLTQKSLEFIPQLKRNIQTNPELSSNEPAEVNLGSLENMQFKLRCVLNTRVEDDMLFAKNLLELVETNGYKFLWYNYTLEASSATTSLENNTGQLLYQIANNSKFGHQVTDGEKTAFGFAYNFYHLHVLFTDIQYKHSGNKGLITYELTGIVLPVETSTI